MYTYKISKLTDHDVTICAWDGDVLFASYRFDILPTEQEILEYSTSVDLYNYIRQHDCRSVILYTA